MEMEEQGLGSIPGLGHQCLGLYLWETKELLKDLWQDELVLKLTFRMQRTLKGISRCIDGAEEGGVQMRDNHCCSDTALSQRSP